MSAPLSPAAANSDGRWIFRTGGIAAFVLVAAYLLTFPIYAQVGDAPPRGIEAQLAYFARHARGWWAILGLMVFTDLLLVPIVLALYAALKPIGRNGVRLAAVGLGLFVVLDLAITWPAYAALLISGSHHATATTEAQRAVWLAAAAYPSALLASPLVGVYAILVPSLGILAAGLVMLRGVFNRATAWLAIAVGITGILFMGSYAVGGLGILRVVNALLATAWYAMVGGRLLGLGRPRTG